MHKATKILVNSSQISKKIYYNEIFFGKKLRYIAKDSSKNNEKEIKMFEREA